MILDETDVIARLFEGPQELYVYLNLIALFLKSAPNFKKSRQKLAFFIEMRRDLRPDSSA